MAETTAIEFTLTVSDGTATVSDKVVIIITDSANTAPSVDAGADREEAEGSTVNLDATVTDPDTEDALTYTWSHNSTLAITIAGVEDPSFTAPNVAETTAIEFTLTVSDGTATVSDKVVIIITDSANTAPSVDAGADREEAEGSTVNLDATVTDPDTEDALTTHNWPSPLQASRTPWSHNSTLAITIAGVEDPSFTAPNVAETTAIEFTLTVSDGTATVTDTVIITITDSANTAPSVDAGADREEAEGSTVNLDATVTDPDQGDTLTYTWTHNSTLAITIADVEDPSFTAPNVANNTPVEFTLTVSDGTATVSDKVVIIIIDSANTAPAVDAGPDQEKAEGSTVDLDATVTDPDTEDALTYTWTHNSTLTIAIADVEDPSFTAPDVAGITPVQFTLEVSDGEATVTDTVIITITDSATTPPVLGKSSGDRDVSRQSRSATAPPPAITIGSQNHPQTTFDNWLKDFGNQEVIVESQDRQLSAVPVPGTAMSEPVDSALATDVTFPLVINGNGYALHSHSSTVMPTNVTAGQPVTMQVTLYDPAPISYFAIYLNLQGDSISHLQSDAQVVWDSGNVRVSDPNGLMRGVTMTVSEDPGDPAMKAATLTAAFSEDMGKTNMVIRTWNAGGHITQVQVFGVIAVTPPVPETVDPGPTAPLVTVNPEPGADSSTDGSLLAVRMWSGFEPESMTDAQLLASLGLDYPGTDIPGWVMTELGPLAAKGHVSMDEFMTALEYVLNHG